MINIQVNHVNVSMYTSIQTTSIRTDCNITVPASGGKGNELFCTFHFHGLSFRAKASVNSEISYRLLKEDLVEASTRDAASS